MPHPLHPLWRRLRDRRISLWLALAALSCSNASGPGADSQAASLASLGHARTTPALRAVSSTPVSRSSQETPQAQPARPAPTAASATPTTRVEQAKQPDETAAVLALDGAHSTSLGSPGHGTLAGGVRFPDRGPGFLHNPKRPDEARYGTVELVQAIIKAAAVVEREMPGNVLVVNDLGLPHGGPIHQHGSHESGRDADILYYTLDQDDKPLQSVGVPIEPSGEGWDFKDLTTPDDDQRVKLDAPRTWRFIQALIQGDGERVQRLFMVEHVRSMLLAQAERAHAPADVRARFADLTCQPADSPHDDHMHLRVFCSPEDIALGCRDKPPIYPWRELALRALGLEAVPETARDRIEGRKDRAARVTTPAQARRRAGPMHWKVRRFLAEREHWLKQPHPGRPYCR